MLKISIVLAAVLRGVTAAVVPQALLSPELSPLDELKATVGNALVPSKPVPLPCYTNWNSQACRELRTLGYNDHYLTDQPGGYFYRNWGSCQALNERCAMPVNNNTQIPAQSTCYQGSVPEYAVIIDSNKTAELRIKAAYRYANQTKAPLVIKNTGHDWKGRSAGAGALAIWTHKLKGPSNGLQVRFDWRPTGCKGPCKNETVLMMGGGENWKGAYEAAHAKGLTVVGGTCGSVGVAGWLHGGGHSPLTPDYGLGADNVREIEIITPKGEVRIANDHQNSDLFFAVRGGGGGTWGVVTRIVYRAVKEFKVQYLTPLTQEELAEFYDIVTREGPKWAKLGWGGYIKPKTMSGNGWVQLVRPARDGANDTARAAEELQPLLDFNKRHLTNNSRVVVRASWYDYYQAILAQPNTHVSMGGAALASRLIPPEQFVGARRAAFSKELLRLCLADRNLVLMLVTPVNYKSTISAPSALHPSWDTAIWSVRINDQWDPYVADTSALRNWQRFDQINRLFDPLRAMTPRSSISLSEADIWEPRHTEDFWGAKNYGELLSIKKRHDPFNLLSNYMAINWASAKDPRYKCYPKKNEPPKKSSEEL